MASVGDLADATRSSHLKTDSLVTVHWLPQKCPILKHEVKILDSPGIDVDQDIDAWIQRYCMDADVFVLVNNAESTMTQSEKLFFHRVANIISKPNIFILNNRFLASSGGVAANKPPICSASRNLYRRICCDNWAHSRLPC